MTAVGSVFCCFLFYFPFSLLVPLDSEPRNNFQRILLESSSKDPLSIKKKKKNHRSKMASLSPSHQTQANPKPNCSFNPPEKCSVNGPVRSYLVSITEVIYPMNSLHPPKERR